MFKSILPGLILILSSSILHSQSAKEHTSRWGKDSIQCISNLSSMSEFAKIKVYDYALEPWRSVFNLCPQASKNIYIYGAAIYKNLIEKTSDTIRKKELQDTLMLIYDRRIEYFGEKGNVVNRKALDLLNYSPENKRAIYSLLMESIKLQGVKSESGTLVTFLQISAILTSTGEISKDDFFDDYSIVTKVIDKLLQQSGTNESLLQAKENIDKIYISQSDCSKTDSVFQVKIKSGADLTPDQLKQIVSLLEISKCTDGESYLLAIRKLYEKEPNAERAAILARIYKKNQDYTKATEYYLLAVDKESNTEIAAQLYYELAAIEFSTLNQFQKAKEHALKAAELKKEWGKPFILIGNMYAASSQHCKGNELEKASIFWAAADKYIQAKNTDPAVQTEANEYINNTLALFPNKETIFFNGYKIGDTFQVKCWINESTKVRAR